MIVADTYLVIGMLMSAAAEQVFARDPDWHLPVLWRSEFTNALATLVRTKRVGEPTAAEALRRGLTLFGAREHRVDFERVLKLAATSGCTAYDCEFVWLAERLTTVVVTGDKSLLRAFPRNTVSPQDYLR